MNNLSEVRNSLSAVFNDLRNEKIQAKVAKELNNCAGKIISSCKVQLEYFELRKEKPNIAFFK